MPIEPLFPSKYPRGTSTGTVAVLCEGDINSYEADFLEKWSSFALPLGPDVHVWPCGTVGGVRGMADAIGRSVRILVLLDRDFHDQLSATAMAKKWSRDAESLGWSFLGMRMWLRHEIENYFLDEDVLVPVMTEAFGCEYGEVRQVVDIALQLLVPFQALRAAVHKARTQWEDSGPDSVLLNVSSRPRWQVGGLVSVDVQKLESELFDKIKEWQRRAIDGSELCEPWKGGGFLELFQRRLNEWSSCTCDSAEWRIEWAGKEVLQLVRQQLAAKNSGVVERRLV